MALYRLAVGWIDAFLALSFFAFIWNDPVIGGPVRPAPASSAVIILGLLIANAVALLVREPRP